MSYKTNAARSHHLSQTKQQVTNLAVYNEALRQRDSLPEWFTDEAIVT
jgi:hypothetical protein